MDVWPNITGSTKAIPYRQSGSFTGVFSGTSTGTTFADISGSSDDTPTSWIDFSAHDGNALYGGSTLQVPAAQVLMIIRT